MAKSKPTTAKPTSTTAGPGRPEGSPNVTDQIVASLPRCNKCRSTRLRCEATKTTRGMTTVKGLPVSRTHRTRCTCQDCLHVQIVVSHSFHIEDEGQAA